MGTSSIYDGPMDNNPLLPDDIDELMNGEDQKDGEQIPESKKPKHWQNAKNSMSKYASGTSSNYKNAVKKYVQASGGSNKLAVNSAAGKSSLVRFGQALASFSENGVTETFRKLRIETTGKDVEVLFSELINAISVESNTKDESIAKDATVEALMVIYEHLEENNLDIESLEKLDDTLFDTALCEFTTSYIWGKILSELEKSFEKNGSDALSTIDKEKDIKEYIRNVVDIEFSKSKIDSKMVNESNIQSKVNELFREIYSTLEGVII
jgi:hypothetical protein